MIEQVANVDLFFVGLAVAAIGILGFIVFFNNRKSITARTFFFFAFLTNAYGIVNFLSYQPRDPLTVLWLLRFTVFFATWHAFSVLTLFSVFPDDSAKFAKSWKFFFLPLAIITSLLTLTPLVFKGISGFDPINGVSIAEQGPLLRVFSISSGIFVLYGLFLLIRKIIRTSKPQRPPFRAVLLGTILTFVLILILNLVLPLGFQIVRFIPFAPLYFFPFVVCVAYAIFRHHLLNVKILTTEVLTLLLAVATFAEVVVSHDPIVIVLRSGVFLLVLAFGILLIRSVLKEVKQREELQELTQKLAVANGELQNLSQFKTQLLSLASHQIKSPLAAIKGFAAILLEGLYGPLNPKVKEVIEKMKHSTDELVDLINSLLDLRKVEEGKMEYKFVKTDVIPMIKELVDQLGSLAIEKKLQFSFTPQIPTASVNADGQKLKQVFQNLIDNSIKYTPSGFVKVTLEEKENGYLFCVADSGLGMPESLLPQLFEEFVRDTRVKQQIRGTGLGLYIARKIVEAHGGRIWAHSEGEGKGSQFCVWLPAMK